MKKPFLNALAAALYIVVIVFAIKTISSLLSGENLLMPITMLSLFVLSVSVMGFLFLAEPLQLLIDNKKQEAVTFFLKVLGIFAIFVGVFTILLFFI